MSRTFRRKLAFESLESRRVLAGNVMAVVDGAGDLVITGNNASNHIKITPYVLEGVVQANAYVIESRLPGSPTNINGQATPVVVQNVTNNVLISMARGNDSVEVEDGGTGSPIQFAGMVRFIGAAGNDRLLFNEAIVNGDLNVFSGTGNDLVAVYQTNVLGETLISTGRGNDRVGLNEADLDDAAVVNTGGGRDRIGVHGSVVTTLEINSGAGNDTLGIGVNPAPLGVTWANLGVVTPTTQAFGVDADGLNVNTGGASDTLGVELSDVAVDAVFATGGGNDVFRYQDNTVDGSVRILGGGAQDTVEARRNQINGNLVIRLFGANDRLVARNNTIVGNGTLVGGSGFDTLVAANNTFNGSPFPQVLVGFENIIA